MRVFFALILSSVLGLICVWTVSAQPQGLAKEPAPPFSRPDASPPMLMLLGEKSVQADLKITAAESKKISAAMAKQQMAMRAVFNSPPDQRMQKVQEIIKAGDQTADDLLTAVQKKRMKQIVLQLQGSQAFAHSDVVNKLNLTEEQQTKIKAINDEIGKQMDELFRGKKVTPQVFEKRMAETKKKAANQATKVLTSEQSSMWSEMTGLPFRGEVRMMPPLGLGPPPGFGPAPGFPPK